MEETKRNNKSKRSPYWNHFTEIGDNTGNKRRAKCEHCYQILAIGPGCTGNLARHLRQKHPAVMMFIEQGVELNESEMSETVDGECETEDEQRYNEVFVISGNSDEELQEQVLQEQVTKPCKRMFDSENLQKREAKIFKSYFGDAEIRKENEEDRYDVFGKLIAIKLRSLDRKPRMLAEKIINDTLHEAEMGKLNEYCSLKMVELTDNNIMGVSSVNNGCDEKNEVSTNSS